MINFDESMKAHSKRGTSNLLEHLITEYRWFFCIFFLLPLSAAFETFLKLKHFWIFWTREKAPQKHKERVLEVQRQVRKWREEGMKTPMCTARPGWQTMSLRVGKYKKTDYNIRLDLFDILKIDPKNELVHVEPMVTMGQLTAALNPMGWTLPVVPELDDLTIGGLIAGVGVETSSHIYGLFQHICVEYEVVLADSTVIICNKTKFPELFYNIPWSHGTLGFLVSAMIKIVPCKPYVKLEYIPCSSRTEVISILEVESRKGKVGRKVAGVKDFVEALAFSPSKYVVMIGDMVEEKEVDFSKLNKIGNFWKPWFFMHVAKYLNFAAKGGSYLEYIPLRHYYHRHTRSLFWEVSEIIPFGNDKWFRYSLGWMMPPKPSLLKLTQTETLRELYEKHHVVQDMLVPFKDLEESLRKFDKEFNIYPLWLCPMRVIQSQDITGLINPPNKLDDLFVDIGGYGTPKIKSFQAKESCQRVEAFVRSKGGFQMMYADTYMTRDEFREMFDHKTYDKLREDLNLASKGFPEIYDKVCKKNRI
mmetsp:Transcript_10908/g.15498  ORF Transcript_10908/g.15498 Transcript_10908/m.15498 type:complete len:532 (-) Transcript_10908:83-1678(-)